MSNSAPLKDDANRGWYSREYIPHVDLPGLTQFITFRLHDSIPKAVLEAWKLELATMRDRERRKEEEIRVNRFVDDGLGECWLRRGEVARFVEEALLKFHGDRYEIHAWTIMPNHVHCLARFEDEVSLPGIVQKWKGVSARRANDFLGRGGTFWARDYYDRFIRNAEHFDRVVRYIDHNPVKARLCDEAENWPFGSSRFRSRADRNVGGPRQ